MANQIIIARQFRGTELFFAGILPNGTDWSNNRDRAVKFGSAEGLRPILDAINAFASDVQAYARDAKGNVLVPAAAADVVKSLSEPIPPSPIIREGEPDNMALGRDELEAQS